MQGRAPEHLSKAVCPTTRISGRPRMLEVQGVGGRGKVPGCSSGLAAAAEVSSVMEWETVHGGCLMTHHVGPTLRAPLSCTTKPGHLKQLLIA